MVSKTSQLQNSSDIQKNHRPCPSTGSGQARLRRGRSPVPLHLIRSTRSRLTTQPSCAAPHPARLSNETWWVNMTKLATGAIDTALKQSRDCATKSAHPQPFALSRACPEPAEGKGVSMLPTRSGHFRSWFPSTSSGQPRLTTNVSEWGIPTISHARLGS